MSDQNHKVGTFVKHINKPGKIFVVLGTQAPGSHLLKSLPNNNGNYEICRGDYKNLISLEDDLLNQRGFWTEGNYTIKNT